MLKRFRFILPLIALLVLLSTIALPAPVYAATQVRAVIGEGTNTDGFYVGGAANFTNVTSDDGDTSTLRMQNLNLHHDFDFTAFAAAPQIDSVTLTLKSRLLAGAGQLRHYVITENVTAYSGYTDVSTAYVEYNYVWAVNPSTGEAWTQANLNAAEFGINWNDTDTIAITYVFLTVTYTADMPTMQTDNATLVTGTSATFNGDVVSDGGNNILTRGFVWDTASVPVNPGNVALAASGYANNWSEGAGAGNYGESPFNYPTGAVLVAGTRYYYRAAAENANGWAYGEEAEFDALDDPAITTEDAILERVYTVRLTSIVDNDGGEACTVQFAYATTAGGPYANYAAIAAAGTTADATGTWTTGQKPYVDLNALAANTDYTFEVSITNSLSTQYGGQDTFTTLPTIYPPIDVTVICDDDSISLIWSTGEGSTNTLVMAKEGTYPDSTTDGTRVYFDTAASVEHMNLDSGTTYYYMLWGESGGVYSSDNTTIFGTTTALAAGVVDFDAPNIMSEWFAAPDHTKMQNTPVYGLVNWWADTVEMPRNTLWFLFATGIAIMAGVGTYAISHKIPISMTVVAVISIGASFGGIMSMFLVFIFIIVATAFWVVGERG